MKKRLLIMLIAFSSMLGANAQKFLYVVGNDGSETVFSINKLHQLTFPEDSMVIEISDEAETTFAFNEIAEFGFRQKGLLNDSSDDNYETNIKSLSMGNLSLYPNPVSNSLFVDISGINYAGDIMITIINLQGSVVVSQKSSINANKSTITLDVNNMSSGMYLCRIYINNDVRSLVKFIKQ